MIRSGEHRVGRDDVRRMRVEPARPFELAARERRRRERCQRVILAEREIDRSEQSAHRTRLGAETLRFLEQRHADARGTALHQIRSELASRDRVMRMHANIGIEHRFGFH